MEKNFGLKFDTFNENDFFLGGSFLGTKEINPNGDWIGFAPLPEYQSNKFFDTLGCARWGTLNAIEILASFVLHEDWNKSDRFLCIVDKCGRNGAKPNAVAEAIRKIGCIDESELPFDQSIDTLDKFFSPDPMLDYLLIKAKNFLKQYSIGHEWVYPVGTNQENKTQRQLITQALKRSPVCISVSAWHSDGLGGYDQQWGENHWCVILKEDEVYYHIYDSYDDVIKKYDKMAKITLAKIFIIRKLIVEDQTTMFTKFWNWIISIISKEVTDTTVKPIVPTNNETLVPIKKSDITIGTFCNSLKKTEGWFLPGTTANGVYYPKGSRSYRNNNPGCLSPRDGVGLSIGFDDIGLAIFPTYKDGFMALTIKIRNICEGKSTKYSPNDTILKFCQTYSPAWVAGNHPENKAKIIANDLGVNYKIFKMKELL